MKTKFEFYAHHFINQWYFAEQTIFQKIQSNDRETRLEGLKKGGTYFKIARSLPIEFENKNGKKRYEPVLEILESDPLRNCSQSDFSKKVEKVHNELSKHYDNRTVISATSKFLWLKYRNPVKILDSRSKNALGIKTNNYSEFVDAWEKKYSELKPEIIKASRRLPSISEFVINDSADIKHICKEEWFLQRVFDTYLWYYGLNA